MADEVSGLVSELYALTDPSNVRAKIEELSGLVRKERARSEGLKRRNEELERELAELKGECPQSWCDESMLSEKLSDHSAVDCTARLIQVTQSMAELKREHDRLVRSWEESMNVDRIEDHYRHHTPDELADALRKHQRIVHGVSQLLIEQGPQQSSLFRDESEHFLTQIVCWLRSQFRSHFDRRHSDKHGHFVESELSRIVHSYGYWVDYLRGNHVLDGHSDDVYSAVITRDGRRLYTSSNDKCIICWDLSTNTEMDQWQNHAGPVECLAIHDRFLVSGSDDCILRTWDLTNHQIIRRFRGHTESVFNVDVSKAGDRIVSCSADNTIREWCVNTGVCLKVFIAHSNSVKSIHYINEDMILSSSSDQSMIKWDRNTGAVDQIISDEINGDAWNVSINCDRSLVACGLLDKTLIYEYPSMKVKRTIDGGYGSMCFHPFHPHIFAMVMLDHSVEIFHVISDDLMMFLEGHSGNVLTLCFSPDGSRLVSTSQDNTARVWDLSTLMDLDLE